MKPQAFIEWQEQALASKSDFLPLVPELGTPYITFNGSLVFVYRITPLCAYARVLEGGHRYAQRHGSSPGDYYELDNKGCPLAERSGPWSLMALKQRVVLTAEAKLGCDISSIGDIIQRLEWRLQCPPAKAKNAVEGYYRDLQARQDMLRAFGPYEPVPAESDELYHTFNGSLVMVLVEKGELNAVVLRGGHGHPLLSGEKPGEGYRIESDGHVARVSDGLELGMSLKSQIPKAYQLPQ